MKPRAGIPTLHHLESSQSLRILWALEELVQAYPDDFTYNLKVYARVKSRAPPELKEIEPQGKSPILVVDQAGLEPGFNINKDGQALLTESRLILQFLADHYTDGDLWDQRPSQTPSDPSTRGDHVRNVFWQEFANSTLSLRVTAVEFFDMVPSQLPFVVRPLLGPIFYKIAKILQNDLPVIFQSMEDELVANAKNDKLWFAGKSVGLADFNLSWGMDTATQRGYFDGSKYPQLKAWCDRVHAREAYKKAIVKSVKYDLVNF